MRDHQGVIAISFTNKASNELKERCIGDGLGKKMSFFGTIDSFFISEIIIPFLPHIWGHNGDLFIRSDSELEGLIEDFEVSNGLETNKIILAMKNLYVDHSVCLLEKVGILGNFVYENSLACRKYLAARYTHVMVDEYQDSDKYQHKMFKRLTNLGLISIGVGDANQSIFGFAGKSPEYLMDLTSDCRFKSFGLTKNMRCHPSITNYSLSMISQNPTLLPCNDTRVFYRRIYGGSDQFVEWFTHSLEGIKVQFNISRNCEIGVLFISNRGAEDFSKAVGLPCKYSVATKIDNDYSPCSVLYRHILNYVLVPNKTKTGLIEGLSAQISIRKLRVVSKLLDELKQNSPDLSTLLPRLETFKELSDILLPNESSRKSLALLGNVLSDQEQLNSYIPPLENEIQSMTLHKSKGLEFQVVFHMDLHNWILPSYQALKGSMSHRLQDLNLHYVGVTRAIEACFLVSTSKRVNSSGEVKDGVPSDFLNENNLQDLRNNKEVK